MEDNQSIEIPRSLELANYTYTYKDELTNNYFSYRCKHRTICKITIKIAKSEIIKYVKNKVINIEYTITSKEKNHICKENIKEDKITKIKDFKNNLLKSIIISNLEKPLSFHI